MAQKANSLVLVFDSLVLGFDNLFLVFTDSLLLVFNRQFSFRFSAV